MGYPRRLLTVVLLCALVVVPTVPLSLVEDDHAVSGVDLDATLREGLDQQRADAPTVDAQVRVVVKLQDHDTAVPETDGFDVERVYTKEDQRLVRGSIPMAEVNRLSDDPRTQGVRIASGDRSGDGRTADGVALVGADRLHDGGVTGENVTVGVVDAEFRVSHPEIADSATYYRQFEDVRTADWQHGTAVASVVADTAPGADLHLAAIGSTTTPEEYRRAIRFLLESGADVIVDAGSYYGQPGDGSGELAEIAASASEEAVFVTSAGNHGRSYWRGNHTGGPFVQFNGSTDGNVLGGGEPFSGRVQVTARWAGWPETDADYDLFLMRERRGEDEPVAVATGHDGRPVEYLDARVSEGRYYVSIRAANATGPRQVELFANRNLTHRTTGGTTAPATAPGVLAVGASVNGTVEPFSAGERVDLVAPDAVETEGVALSGGTSFSAPYVAGVAALTLDEHPDATPETVRARLRTGAVDIGPDGVDAHSGYGRIDAVAAVTGPAPTDDAIENATVDRATDGGARSGV